MHDSSAGNELRKRQLFLKQWFTGLLEGAHSLELMGSVCFTVSFEGLPNLRSQVERGRPGKPYRAAAAADDSAAAAAAAVRYRSASGQKRQ